MKVLFPIFILALVSCSSVNRHLPDDGIDKTVRVIKICKDGQQDTADVVLSRKKDFYHFRLAKETLSKLESVEIIPDFEKAKYGDEGYYVFPHGFLFRFNLDTTDRYTLSSQPLPIAGALTPSGCWLEIVKGLRMENTLSNVIEGGSYSLRRRFDFKDVDPYEDLIVDYYPLYGDDASYSGMGRAYRSYQLKLGKVLPLKKRIVHNDVLRYAAACPEIRIRQGWKPAPPKIMEQTLENEPEMKVAVTFSRVKDIVDALQSAGVDKAELCLVGWNIRGHDGRWPTAMPPEPALGGEEELRSLIRYAQDKGYQITCHTNATDAYSISEYFGEDIVAATPEGEMLVGRPYSGGRMYKTCMRQMKGLVEQLNDQVRNLGFRGLHYIDVISNEYPRPCYAEKHAYNRAEQAAASAEYLRDAAKKLGGAASEGPHDYVAGELDYVLYVTFRLKKEKWPKLSSEYVPLWQIVYNGIILNNAAPDCFNYTIKEPAVALKVMEYGSRPSFYFYSSFKDDGKGWSGSNVDLRCGDDLELQTAVDAISKAYRQWKELAYLQYEFLDEHKMLTDSVSYTRWADGSILICNYASKKYSYNGTVVARNAYRLFKPAHFPSLA